MNMKAIVTHYLPCKDRCTFPIVQWTIVHKYSKHSLYGYNTHKGIVAHIELYF